MRNYNDETLLEIVEMYAEEAGLISSEEELSEIFDNIIVESVISEFGEDDRCAINQAFNDYTDGICKDGEIHPEQYNKYTYVGKYSE